MEVSHTPRITAQHLAVDQAGPDLEVVHSLNDERIARRPVVTSTGDQPDAHGVATGHEPMGPDRDKALKTIRRYAVEVRD